MVGVGGTGADVFAGAKGVCLRQGVSLKRGGDRSFHSL